MKVEFQEHWDKLYEFLDEVRKSGRELCISRDEIIITITDLERKPSGCGRCKSHYECFEMSGMLKASYHEIPWQWLSYPVASISQYEMHKCIDDEEPEHFCMLFKPYVEGTKYCVPSTFFDPKLIGLDVPDFP